jgi:hypothetical protein
MGLVEIAESTARVRKSGDRDDEPLPRSAASRLQLGDRARSPQKDSLPSPRRAHSREKQRRRERRVSEAEEQRLLEACKLLNEPTRSMAKLNWDDVYEIRARAQAGIEQREIAAAFKISRPLCSAIVRGHIWNREVKLTTSDEMRDRIIGALDT